MACSISLNEVLSEVSSLQELCENVRTSKWRALGTMVELEKDDLENIERKGNFDECLSEMYTLWLQIKCLVEVIAGIYYTIFLFISCRL